MNKKDGKGYQKDTRLDPKGKPQPIEQIPKGCPKDEKGQKKYVNKKETEQVDKGDEFPRNARANPRTQLSFFSLSLLSLSSPSA